MDPRFTVYQIIAEPIRNFRKLSKKEEEREINDLLTMMELPEEIKLRKAHELSGGQQKRVCIARALAAQPDVLIFDEAVSGLDVLVRKHILDLLKRLHQERKMTCFFITSAVSSCGFPLQPRINPCSEGRFCPLRHSLTLKGTWA